MALYTTPRTSRVKRSKNNPVWVTPAGSAVAHTPAQWAAYQTKHVGAQLPRQARREADVEAHGPLAPGWDILPNFVTHDGGKRQQIYRLFYKGKDTGKYSLDARKAAEMSHGINPATGKRWKKGEQMAQANPGRAAYVMFAQAAKAKGKTPTQIKKAYAKKKAADKPIKPSTLTDTAIHDIFAASQKFNVNAHELWSAGAFNVDAEKAAIRVELPSSKYTMWKVDDPKYVNALRAIAKKHAAKGLKMTVAVKNPRY